MTGVFRRHPIEPAGRAILRLNRSKSSESRPTLRTRPAFRSAEVIVERRVKHDPSFRYLDCRNLRELVGDWSRP